jgi:hypothetical protein
MHTFSEYLLEAKIPKKKNGISIISLADFLTEQLIAEAPFLGATMRPFPHDELQSYLGRTKEGTKGKLEKYAKPYIHGSNIEIKDGRGQEYDLDKLRALITARPKNILKQNEKMVHSDGTSSVFFNIGLPALKGLAVNETTGEFVIVDTCPGAGLCKTFCYAMKGGYVQFPDASLGTTRVLNFLLNDPAGFKQLLTNEIGTAERKFHKKGTKVVVRWHDAGDFFSPDYMDMAFDIARQFPSVEFYAYTKIAAVAQSSSKPINFVFNFSGGAQPSQEKLISFGTTKHSRVVPKELFSDLILKKGRSLVRDAAGRWQFTSPASLQEFKRRLAHKYAITNMDTIITYDDMLQKPVGTAPHWNVLVWPGHGDESATRRDVHGTYLLVH